MGFFYCILTWDSVYRVNESGSGTSSRPRNRYHRPCLPRFWLIGCACFLGGCVEAGLGLYKNILLSRYN